MEDGFSCSILINAAPETVWTVLTATEQISQWMGPEMNIRVATDWRIGSPVIITGFHHVHFENKGRVLECQAGSVLSYSHLSSLSRLPDEPQHYTVLRFTLVRHEAGTTLQLTIRNFPTETIRRHMEFYWRTAIHQIKKIATR